MECGRKGSEEVELTDSDAGDASFYRKHSSNQGLNCGNGQDAGSTYPISNNEDNNGNCWIGRPLIVSGSSAAQYYIKELSRSEGYELSVYGKDMELTNKDAFETGGDVAVNGSVTIGSMTATSEGSGADVKTHNDIDINAVDTTDGFKLMFKDLTKGADIAKFYDVTQKSVEKTVKVKVPEVTETPLMATAGQPVLINGTQVEASLGDTITLPNGSHATVNNTIAESTKKFYKTKNSIPYSLPDAAVFNAATGADFIEKYNNALTAKGFTEPSDKAPWILVPKGATEQESFNNMSSALDEYGSFHQMRIAGEDSGNYVVRYDLGGANAVYDIGNQLVFIKHDVSFDGSAGYIYEKLDATALEHTSTGFMVDNKKPDKTSFTKYEDLTGLTFTGVSGKTYWAYASGEQQLDTDGTPLTVKTTTWKEEIKTYQTFEDVENEIPAANISFDAASNTYTLSFDAPGEHKLRIRYTTEKTDELVNADYAARFAKVNYYIAPKLSGTYIKDAVLSYPGDNAIYEAANTDKTPVSIDERPIRQKVKISKDIQTLPETLKVWYCANCGTENADETDLCAYCGRKRTVEATKSIDFAHDTYAAFFNEDLAKDKQETSWIERVKKWFGTISGITGSEDSSKAVANFRFKAYLKSNLERLYRNEEGKVLWVDRNGNRLEPVYKDTTGNGLYDTFEWSTVYGVNSDFPEKDRVTDGKIESTNVQKIYTEAEHEAASRTTSAKANNVWSDYESPENTLTSGIAERNNYYSTNERFAEDNKVNAVNVNEALYSYVGDNVNVLRSDSIKDAQNPGYTRLLEMMPDVKIFHILYPKMYRFC